MTTLLSLVACNVFAGGVPFSPPLRFVAAPSSGANAQYRRNLNPEAKAFPINHTRLPLPVRNDATQLAAAVQPKTLDDLRAMKPLSASSVQTTVFAPSPIRRADMPPTPLPARVQQEAAKMSHDQAQQILSMITGIKQESEKFGRNLEVLGKHIVNANNTMSTVTNDFGKLQNSITNAASLKASDENKNLLT